MADEPNTSTAGKKPRIDVVFLIFILILLMVGIVYFAANVVEFQNRVAESRNIVFKPIKGLIPLDVTYPLRVNVDAPTARGAPLTIALANPDEIQSSGPFSITLKADDNLLMLTDAEGKALPNYIVLSNTDPAKMAVVVYLHPVDTRNNDSLTNLEVLFPQSYPVTEPEKLPIAIESEWQSGIRFGAGQATTALGIILGLVGAFVLLLEFLRDQRRDRDEQRRDRDEQKSRKEQEDRENKEKERVNQERRYRERLGQLDNLRKRDLPSALDEIMLLQKQIKQSQKDFEQEHNDGKQIQMYLGHQNVLESKRKEILTSKEDLARLLREAGQALDEERTEECQRILKALLKFWGAEKTNVDKDIKPPLKSVERVLAIIQSGYTPPPVLSRTSPEIIEILELWPRYFNNAGDLAVAAFLRLSSHLENSKILEIMGEDGSNKYTGIFLDARLLAHLSADGISPPDFYLSGLYRASTSPSNKKHGSNPLTQLLTDLGLEGNPFGPEDITQDELLKKVWYGPENWHETMFEPKPTMIDTRFHKDSLAAIERMEYSWQNLGQNNLEMQPSFRVKMFLLGRKTGREDVLQSILAAHVQSWLDFITQYPERFFWLISPDQDRVLEMICANGAGTRLLSNLTRAELESRERSPERRTALKLLLEQLRMVSVQIQKQSISDQLIVGWLELRPVTTQYTMLFIPLEETGAVDQELQRIFQVTDLLKQSQVIPKVFAHRNPKRIPTDWLKYELKWSDQELKKTLLDRLKECGVNDVFTALFDDAPREVNLDNELIKKAESSLSEMLRIGNSILRARLARGLGKPEGLLMEDFKKGTSTL